MRKTHNFGFYPYDPNTLLDARLLNNYGLVSLTTILMYYFIGKTLRSCKAMESGICDVIKIRLNRRDATRSKI